MEHSGRVTFLTVLGQMFVVAMLEQMFPVTNVIVYKTVSFTKKSGGVLSWNITSHVHRIKKKENK